MEAEQALHDQRAALPAETAERPAAEAAKTDLAGDDAEQEATGEGGST